MLKTILKTSGFIVCLLVSGVAGAVGLGGMSVTSNLGQPLKAEIELVAVDKADRGSLVAKLASVEDFKNAGIDYPYALPKLKFEIVGRDSSQPVVRISSSQPINEPFVTLLVEASWSSGKLLREYTFLLDPVGFNVEPQADAVSPVAPVVAAPAALATPRVPPMDAAPALDAASAIEPPAAVPAAVESVPAEPATEPAAGMTEATPVATATADATPAAAATAVAAASEPSAEPSAEPAPAAEATPVEQDALSKEEAIPVAQDKTVKVMRGDSLSKIALQAKPDDVSLERMLVALYRANGEAFMGKNMNRLKAGKIIRIPDAAEIADVQQDEAVREYRAQVQDWNAYRQQLAAVRGEARDDAVQQEATGKVTAAVAEKTAPKGAATEVLKLSKGEAPGDEVAAAGTSSKEEETIAKAKALKEAEQRTAMLEKNVQDLQRLAELKKQQEAAAAAQKAPAEAVTAAVGASAPVPAQPTAKPAVPAPVPVPEQAEPAFIDFLLEDPILLGGTAAGAVAVLGLGLWLSRRRKTAAAVPAVAASDLDVGSATGRIAEPVMPSPDTGDFTQMGGQEQEAPASDEVDPIAEAELFLTFGRDVQAEEVLKEALHSRPGDTPILLKLLSIYATRKDANAFMTYARQVKDTGDEGAWQQAAAMGRELEPGNPFYGGSGEIATGSVAEAASEPVVDFDLGFGSSAAETPAAASMDTLVLDRPLASTMDTVILDLPKTPESTAVLSSEELQAASDAPMDFDITGAAETPAAAATAGGKSDFGMGDLMFDVTSTHSGVPSAAAASGSASSGGDDLIFDVTATHPGVPAATAAEPTLDDLVFDVTTAHAPAASAQPSPVQSADEGLTFSLDIPDFKTDARVDEEEQPSSPLDIGLGDISLNLDDAGQVAGSAPAVKDERWQEVATKLDLAKAYQEMGDAAGAREILDEVLQDGDEQQKAAAQAMLEQL